MIIKPITRILFICLSFVCFINASAEPVNILEEIVVVGSKTERPLWSVAGQVETFNRMDLDKQQLQDFSAISRYVPALETDFSNSRFGSTGLSIRGIGGNRVAFEFDGVPLPQQIDVGSFADSGRLSLDPSIIKRVEILRGPASALYGSDAIAGVVVVTSVDGKDLVEDDEQYYLGGNAGYFSANNSTLAGLTFAWAGEQDSVVLALSRRGGHEQDNKARNVETDRIKFDQWQLFGKWTHEFAHGGNFRASIDYFKRYVDSDIRAQLGFERFASTTKLQGDDEQSRKRIALEYTLPAFDWLEHASLTFYWQENQTDQFTDQTRSSRGTPVFLQRDFFFRERDWGGELKLRRDFNTGKLSHVVVTGVEWDRQQLREKRDAVQTNLISGIDTKTILGETFPLRDLPKSTTDKLGIYIQDEILFGTFTLIPALRWDHFNLNADTDVIFTDPTRLTDLKSDDLTFRLGATWRISDYLSLYGHYAEGFRAPPAEDVNLFLDITLFNFRALPNPDLKPERSRNLEAGFRLQWQGTSVTAGAYHSSYDDFIESRALIGIDPVSGTLLFQSRNLAEASIYGVEANLTQSLGYFHKALQEWHFDAAMHWAHGNNDVTDRALNTVSPLKTVLGLRWQSAQLPLSAELRMTHYGRQSRLDFSGGEFFVPGSATVMDMVAHWDQSKHLQWYLGLYNLGDRRYWRYADVRRLKPADPRVEIMSQAGFNAALTLHVNY
jgi:hemoglobin/transferrin/lactoferrin receptor protein